jgi:ABC-type dipeptide/oligopeptide/nickel transport system ATPase subunit
MLSAENITAGYERDLPVLRNVTVQLRTGECLGITGPSGSGKSTLAAVLALLHQPRSGTVRLDGYPVKGIRFAVPATIRRRIGMLFQSPRPAVNPRMRLDRVIGEAADTGPVTGEMTAVAASVGLTPDLLRRFPHQVSVIPISE